MSSRGYTPNNDISRSSCKNQRATQHVRHIFYFLLLINILNSQNTDGNLMLLGSLSLTSGMIFVESSMYRLACIPEIETFLDPENVDISPRRQWADRKCIRSWVGVVSVTSQDFYSIDRYARRERQTFDLDLLCYSDRAMWCMASLITFPWTSKFRSSGARLPMHINEISL